MTVVQSISSVSPLRRPIDTFRPPRVSPVLIVVAVVCLLALLIGGYEIAVLHSSFTQALRKELTENARVRSDFGQNIRVPFALGWNSGTGSKIIADVEGSEATGFVNASAAKENGRWVFHTLAVHNVIEDHVIDLSPPPAEASLEQLHGTGRLYLVALGDSAAGEVEGLAKFLHDQAGVPAQVLSPVKPSEAAWDAKRKQWIGEMLIAAMTEKYPEIAADQESKIIGVIDADLYPRRLGWRFAYNYRESGRFAVIPSVRVNPTFYGHKAKDSITTERLQKITLKLAGLFYFGFAETGRPRSVMLWDHTPADMDRMSGQYLLSDLRGQSKDDNTNGTPCLVFSSANVAGVPRLRPIERCRHGYNVGESTNFAVELTSGEFRFGRNDLYRSGPMPLSLERMYFSHTYDGKTRAFGKSTWQNLDDTVWSTDPQSIQTISINGVEFSRTTPGVGFSPQAQYRAGDNQGDFSDAVLSWENGRWRIENSDREVWHYLGCGPNTPVPCYFSDRANRAGDHMDVVRDGIGMIDKVVQKTADNLPTAQALDHTWNFTYQGETIVGIRDSDGRNATYDYDNQGYLTDVNADGHKSHYEYDEAHRMNRIVEDGRELRAHYDSEGRADEIDLPGNLSYRIRYGGESVDVAGPQSTYRVKIRSSYFETSKIEAF